MLCICDQQSCAYGCRCPADNGDTWAVVRRLLQQNIALIGKSRLVDGRATTGPKFMTYRTSKTGGIEWSAVDRQLKRRISPIKPICAFYMQMQSFCFDSSSDPSDFVLTFPSSFILVMSLPREHLCHRSS